MKMNRQTRPLSFADRHIGSSNEEIQQILKYLEASSLEALIQEVLPFQAPSIEDSSPPLSEKSALEKIRAISKNNQPFQSFIGQGYVPASTPPVIQRNILENPLWLTPYTPYQAELAQGRLEALLNFQTMIQDLTGMELAQGSLLDEGSAALEALNLCKSAHADPQAMAFFADKNLFPQTLDVLQTRSKALGWSMETGDFKDFKGGKGFFAAITACPNALGEVPFTEPFFRRLQAKGIKTSAIVDLLSLCLLKPPGEMGVDVVVGSAQRFGVPMFYGGPHAAFFAARKKYAQWIPGRLVGVSKDRLGQTALRLSLQTREQHIRRERATSNICTSQALLAVMAGFYAVYHGPHALKAKALKAHKLTQALSQILKLWRGRILNAAFFDTLTWDAGEKQARLIAKAFQREKINVGQPGRGLISWTLDSSHSKKDVEKIARILSQALGPPKNGLPSWSAFWSGKTFSSETGFSKDQMRSSPFLAHPVFNSFHTETKLLRYITRLQNKDLTLAHSMIPLGSCTMKLNGTSELMPLSWPRFANMHPFAPKDQAQGYRELIEDLEKQLSHLTGFYKFSFQPNAGSQGELAGLLAIRSYFESKNEGRRTICFVPASAHGTNPASAVMAGLQPVSIACGKDGEILMEDLTNKLHAYSKQLACMMITCPSTHGVFEKGIPMICQKIHKAGGLVYLDGANMNALLGIARAKDLGFDICHINLHKTFCVPHGGGGPGAGPVGAAKALAPYLPGHRYLSKKKGAVSSAPYGSAALLIIPWMYINLMGGKGLKKSGMIAIAHANYIAKKLRGHYRILFQSEEKGRVAHECVIDCRKFRHTADISVDDIAKRLMDYGFHAPTMSWPVTGTLMIEPTESESLEEIERFCQALIAIRQEIRKAEKDKSFRQLLKNAPHTVQDLLTEPWPFPYSKKQAFFPADWLMGNKFFPPSARIENSYGDIHLFCSCPPVA